MMKRWNKAISLLIAVVLIVGTVSSQGFKSTIYAQAEETNTKELDISKGSITITSTGYTAFGGTEEVPYTGNYVITGTSTDANNTITVNGQAEGSTIMLDNLDIQIDGTSPLTIGNNTVANIVVGTNGIRFGNKETGIGNKVGIMIDAGSALTMTGTGDIELYSKSAPSIVGSGDDLISIETSGNISITGDIGIWSSGDISLLSSNGKIDINVDRYPIYGKNITAEAKQGIYFNSKNLVGLTAKGSVSLTSKEGSVSISTEAEGNYQTVSYDNQLVIQAQKDITVSGSGICIQTNPSSSAKMNSAAGGIHITSNFTSVAVLYDLAVSAPTGGVYLSNKAKPEDAPIVYGTLSVAEGTTCHLSGGIDNMSYAADGTIDRIQATLGKTIDLENCTTKTSGFGYSWDPDQHILTLNNLDLNVASGHGIILPADVEVTVVVTGKNQITVTEDPQVGIVGWNNKITLLGEGELSISGSKYFGSGINCEELVISSGIYNVSGYYGIIADSISILDGKFIISGEAVGLKTNKDIKISGGTIEIRDGQTGIGASGDVIISGGSINIHDTSRGISIGDGDFTMNGGNLNINCKYFGLYTRYDIATGKGKIRFLNGNCTVNAEETAIFSRINNETNTINVPSNIEVNTKNLTLSGGTLTSSEWSKYIDSYWAWNTFHDSEEVRVIMGISLDTMKVEGASNKIVIQPINACQVSFESDGGTKVADQIVAKGTKITKPSQPERSGYTFLDWYKDADFATVWDFDKDIVTKDTTLYAKWKQDESGSIIAIPDATLTPVASTTENKDGSKTTTKTTTTTKRDGSTVIKKEEITKDRNQQIISQSQTIEVKAKDGSAVSVVIEQNANGIVTSVNGLLDLKEKDIKVADNVALIKVTVPEEIIKTAVGETEGKTGSKAGKIALSVNLKSEEMKEQLSKKEIKEVKVQLTLPESISKEEDISLSSIVLPKEILEEAKEKGKIVNVIIDRADGSKISWNYNPSTMKNTSKNMQDANLLVDTKTTENLLKSSKNSIKGVVVDVKQEGVLPGFAKLRVYVAGNYEKTGIKAGSRVYLYDYSEITKTFLELPTMNYKVDGEGYITIDVSHGSQYIVLPAKLNDDNVSSLLEQISVKKEIKMTVKGNNSAGSVQVSLTDIFVSVKKFSKEANPATAEIKLTYKSSNKKVVTVSSTGKLKAKKAGTATITVTAKLADGTKKTFKETVLIK